jgi:hypothetical protein
MAPGPDESPLPPKDRVGLNPKPLPPVEFVGVDEDGDPPGDWPVTTDPV